MRQHATRLVNGIPGPRYWQNRADYALHATLDAVTGTIQKTMTLRYTKDLPDTNAQDDSLASRASQVGTPAPPLAVTAWLNTPAWLGTSATVPFGDGHVYVLGFTAYWCEACPRTYEPLMTLAHRYAHQGVRVLLVTAFYGKDLPYLRKDFQKTTSPSVGLFVVPAHPAVTLPIAIDGVPNDTSEAAWSPKSSKQFGVGKSVPWAIIVDQRGIIRYRLQGVTEGYLHMLTTVLDSLVQPAAKRR